MPAALLALTISAFAIGTTEFVIVGLLPSIAADLGVNLPAAGLLVSLYALGVAVGAPVLTALTRHWPRRPLLLALMAGFIAGNLLAWLSPGYGTLVVARVLTGLTHGVFFSIGSVLAANVVPREKAASAIAMMFSGLTVALVTGVPLGTLIGQHIGWRATFLAVAALGAIALLGCALFMPRNLARGSTASLREQVRVLAQPRLLLVYAMTAVGYGGSFIAFTFLAPMLTDITGLSADAVSGVLLIYGISVAAGNLWGGKLADRRGPIAALSRIFALLALVLLALGLAAPHPVLMLAAVLAWGAVAFGNVPGLQLYVVRQAQRYTPAAMDVAAGLNIAAFNLGIAGGAWAGGHIVASYGLIHTTWIGALIVLLALGLTRWSGWLDRRDAPAPASALASTPAH